LALCELAVLLVVLAVLPMIVFTNSGAPDVGASSAVRGAQASHSRVRAPEHCPAAQHKIGHYRPAYTRSRSNMGLSGAPARAWYPCQAARRRAVEWRDRAWQAKKAYADWHEYHYDWQKWLPWNWQGVARCETHFNWEHNNSRFVSAFGISWREYNADAAYMGAPPWHVRHTPRDQYMAALGHYKRFGDGWTCPGP
jgi:hypothetical protein